MSYSNGKSTSKIPYERSLLWSSFFLGFCLAIFIALGGVISSVVWACHGIDFSEDEPCPEVLVQHGEVGRLGKILKRNKVIDYHVVRGNNAECACRYLNSFFTSKPASTTGVVDTCSPVVNDYSEVCFPEDSSKSQATMKYASAFTQEKLPLSASEINLITILGKGVESTVPHWNERSREVPWGGSGAAWFAPALSGAATSLEKLQGGLLYYSYLRIMKWPDNMVSTFPFKLCAKGCDAEFALGHTLHFRETYKPWLVSPTTIKENQNGYVYHHGFSPPLEGENGSHALVRTVYIEGCMPLVSMMFFLISANTKDLDPSCFAQQDRGSLFQPCVCKWTRARNRGLLGTVQWTNWKVQRGHRWK